VGAKGYFWGDGVAEGTCGCGGGLSAFDQGGESLKDVVNIKSVYVPCRRKNTSGLDISICQILLVNKHGPEFSILMMPCAYVWCLFLTNVLVTPEQLSSHDRFLFRYQTNDIEHQRQAVDTAIEQHGYQLDCALASINTNTKHSGPLTPKKRFPSIPLRMIVSASSVLAIPGASADLKGPMSL
jgi:hypothetical protein